MPYIGTHLYFWSFFRIFGCGLEFHIRLPDKFPQGTLRSPGRLSPTFTLHGATELSVYNIPLEYKQVLLWASVIVLDSSSEIWSDSGDEERAVAVGGAEGLMIIPPESGSGSSVDVERCGSPNPPPPPPPGFVVECTKPPSRS